MDGKGILKVRVYTSRAEIPLEQATVVVTQRRPDGNYRLLSVQSTDSSGLIRPVTVDTPMLWESTAPDSPDTPYAQCEIWAQHPGFAVLLVEGVQVFPGVETFQAMELTPLSEGQGSLENTEIRDIPSQNL